MNNSQISVSVYHNIHTLNTVLSDTKGNWLAEHTAKADLKCFPKQTCGDKAKPSPVWPLKNRSIT